MDNCKLLLMVISSNTYPAMRNSKAQQKIYKKKNDDFQAYWYRGIEKNRQLTKSFELKNQDLILDCSDDSRQMGQKTIQAFEWAINNINFDYLIRPTPSSYVNLDYIEKMIDDDFFKNEIVYAGTVHSLNDKDGTEKFFISGSTLILNRKCVELIVQNKTHWNHEYWDDVALGDLLQNLDIKFTDLPRTDIEGNPFKQQIQNNNYQFRCRADNHYFYPRVIEANVLKVLDDIISNKNITFIRKFILNLYFETAKIFYINQFSWKAYSFFRKIAKNIIPDMVYIKLKNIFSSQITKFKHKRFKY